MQAVEKFIAAFQASVENNTLVKCTLSKPTSAAPDGLKNVYLRLVTLKKGLHVAFNYRYQTRDEAKNYAPMAAAPLLKSFLGASFLNAELFTTERNITLQINKEGDSHLSERKTEAETTVTTTHNREKNRLIDPAAPWLHALGITSARGDVHAHAQDKWRQINKYLEIIQSLLLTKPLPNDARIADMGSGKGYLTFALYDFLQNHLGLQPRLTGIELRQNLVDFCNETANSVGFKGLQFLAQDIGTYQTDRLDMLIALHACDTATDLALAAGIRQKAKIIVAAPCCHKQIRKAMQTQNELAPVLRHGILEERQAEIITDGIRALLLEANGYQTKVFEFVSSEHTAKNVMITATLSRQSDGKKSKAMEQIGAIKKGFGIQSHFLETLLTIPS
ncbi:MAG: SAM-dependent methyltransferase [Saprospiraceae bacterium]|nr:SAM-dependent methyltransferase [Saprospiraceae bacterium]